MPREVTSPRKALPTRVTNERPFVGMSSKVVLKVLLLSEAFRADMARKVPLTAVVLHVDGQVAFPRETLATDVALPRSDFEIL